jgi:REP element-mobilizing transposase RayT
VFGKKNYYESIVRDEKHLNNIRQYIINNPQQWDDDPEKPSNTEIMIDLDF